MLGRLEFMAAGEQGPTQEAETALLAGEIDRHYGRWGLVAVEGLEIDGEAATPETLLESGPEGLVHEVLEAVRREAGLNEEGSKNSESHSTSCKDTRPGGNATTVGA